MGEREKKMGGKEGEVERGRKRGGGEVGKEGVREGTSDPFKLIVNPTQQ